MLTGTGRPSTQGAAVVIEDDLDIRNLVCAVMRQAGFDVHSSATGRDGVELVRRTAAAVVTIDIGLPDIDGYEVLRRIRDISDCHVIMVTARTTESNVATAFRCGADDYLPKPFRPRELMARVDAVRLGLHTGTAHAAQTCFRGSIPTGHVVRGSWRPLKGTHESPESLATTRMVRTAVESIQIV